MVSSDRIRPAVWSVLALCGSFQHSRCCLFVASPVYALTPAHPRRTRAEPASLAPLSSQELPTRRDVLSATAARLVRATAAAATTIVATPNASNAACLAGDLSKDCIGVYKVPIDDAILPYVSTPEALRTYAPDLRYVPPVQSPGSYRTAIEILETQQLAAQDIRDVVLAGRLEEAGIKVLNLVPKVTTAGRLVLSTVQSRIVQPMSDLDTVRMTKLERTWDLVQGYWGECDMVIGQGIRGELGVSAVAQLQILSSLRDAIGALDDFVASVPKQ